jgi:hypothetical protein
MTTQPKEVILYLRAHPELKQKWVNQCCACQRLGHKPEMPERLENHHVMRNLRRYLPEMGLNDAGLCEQWAIAYERSRSSM